MDASRCSVWGVLNVTADSFSDGGRFLAVDDAIAHALAMLDEGADVIDVGGESTRPAGKDYGAGATLVDAGEELKRIAPVVRALVARGAKVSVDTTKVEVARAAVELGAAIVNDVSCGASQALLEAVRGADLVLMHNRGRGAVAEPFTTYGDLVAEVRGELLAAADRARQAGVRGTIWIDPGLGFAKTAEQSAALLRHTDSLVATGLPVLVGPSRKSFLGRLAPLPDGSVPPPLDRLGAGAAAVTIAVLGGARGVRVHDVGVMRQAVRLAEEVRR